MQSSFIIDLGSKAQVPVISYSATSPSLNIPSSYFFRATQNEASQVLAISAILRSFVQCKTDALTDFRAQWKRQLRDQDIDLNIFGLWAYDAATALAIAVEDIGDEKISFRMRNFSANSTDLQMFGVSENGPKLGKALSDVNFQGLAGNFSLINGELQYSNIFEIVNVNGIGETGIGFWTPQNGLSRDLKTSTSNCLL